MLSSVEHEKSFITSRPGLASNCLQKLSPDDKSLLVGKGLIKLNLMFFFSKHMKSKRMMLYLLSHDVGSGNDMGLDATKPVFGVSDKVSFKPVSSATETS